MDRTKDKSSIRDEEREPEIKENDESNDVGLTEQVPRKRKSAMNATELQRHLLDKLLKNPDKPVHLPVAKDPLSLLQPPPEFVKTYMGSSAGAGSGEFHVYRHLRRKEMARQSVLKKESELDKKRAILDKKKEEIARIEEELTAKRRTKRQKRKNRKLGIVKKPENNGMKACENNSSSDHEENIKEKAEVDNDEKTIAKTLDPGKFTTIFDDEF
ncbi:PRKR-interacting protein 1-like protein [Smittium mucronatum]|uniref:PRKR-interacting protein 1-like protein n=1 Tax=Smittium mucronatum TaxID=133383 RepID=A0A1R0GY14_9FUNG|nr:PRKR-interacting protein 1-like protein [Smittium mucronatum]